VKSREERKGSQACSFYYFTAATQQHKKNKIRKAGGGLKDNINKINKLHLNGKYQIKISK
jgi:hypothetical protein